jgi:hypothetical protein
MSLLDGEADSRMAGRDVVTGRYKHGHRGPYRTRQEAIRQRLEALTTAYKAITPADIALLSIAAIHLVDAEKARSRVNRLRATNAAARILRSIPRLPEAESIDDVLRGAR